jgi:hypothetical protein
MKQFNVEIEETEHTNLKVIAAQKGTTIANIIRKLVSDYIKKESK